MKLRNPDPPDLPQATNRRYREARECAQQGRRILRNQADEPTRELAEIIASRQTDGDGSRSISAAQHDQDLIRALAIHESTSGTVRATLQAYLLTDLPYEEIAKRAREAARVVQLYAHCFFDVRGDTTDQTKREVVAAFKHVSSEQHHQDYIWKLIAVTGGVEALEQVMPSPEVRSMQDAAVASAAEAKAIAQHKIAEAAKGIDIEDPSSVRELGRMLDSLDDVQPNDDHQQLLERIDAVLSSLPLTVGPSDPATTPPGLIEFESAACELSLDEHLRVGFGQELPNKQELLEMRFPKGPDDHAALSKPQAPREEPAANGADGDTGAANSISEKTFGNPSAKTNSLRITPAVELQFKLNRLKRENGSPVEKLRERMAALKARKANELLSEKGLRRLDRKWEEFAANTTGAIRNRLWLEFLQQYPGYVTKEARERLKPFKK